MSTNLCTFLYLYYTLHSNSPSIYKWLDSQLTSLFASSPTLIQSFHNSQMFLKTINQIITSSKLIKVTSSNHLALNFQYNLSSFSWSVRSCMICPLRPCSPGSPLQFLSSFPCSHHTNFILFLKHIKSIVFWVFTSAIFSTRNPLPWTSHMTSSSLFIS